MERLDAAHAARHRRAGAGAGRRAGRRHGACRDETGVRAEPLISLNERLLTWPPDLHVHQRLARQLERRRDAMHGDADIDWGHAEALAFASLLAEGIDVRLTGQDAERGTFSHRHAVLHDVDNGAAYTPLQHLPNAGGRFEIWNSPLTELAVLAFEYGYSTASPGALVLWEAQFGDFANMAQPVIDQFIAADTAKWGQDSSVVSCCSRTDTKGRGPSTRVPGWNASFSCVPKETCGSRIPRRRAQYFHMLRRQAWEPVRRPLVLMQPKSMLRLSAAASRLQDLTQGRFQPVIDDPAVPVRDEVTRLVFCTGKLYYELVAGEKPRHLAIARVEELYPWPHDAVSRVVDAYQNVVEIVWAQEEPKNMGSWSYVAPRLRASAGNALIIRYVGRPERASPAEGSVTVHQTEQARIVADALAAPNIPGFRPPRVGAGR